MQDSIQVLTGAMPLGNFIAAMVLALIGFTLQKGLSYRKGIKKSNTPDKFSWSYWVQNNLDDTILQFCIIFTLVRFGPDILDYFSPESKAFFERADAMAIYLVLGFFSTRITAAVKSRLAKNGKG